MLKAALAQGWGHPSATFTQFKEDLWKKVSIRYTITGGAALWWEEPKSPGCYRIGSWPKGHPLPGPRGVVTSLFLSFPLYPATLASPGRKLLGLDLLRQFLFIHAIS
jgi:hypothetical protein